LRCGELRLGGIQRGLRLFVTLPGSRAVAQQVGISLFIRLRLNDRCARCGNDVALGRERKPKIGFVDTHQALTGFDMFAGIHKPLYDLTGDAKAEIALHFRAYGACEAALEFRRLGCGHQSDNRWFLPRIVYGRGVTDEKSNKCGSRQHGGQGARHRNNASLFHANRLKK
jgi:hypothetical protein